MLNYYYGDSIEKFQLKNTEEIIGEIARNGRLGHINTELRAWETQIEILKKSLQNIDGYLLFEFFIPRMGKRIDCLLIIKNIVFILEFKVGETNFIQQNIDQVWDYALDLKHFHAPSHEALLVPVLIATSAISISLDIVQSQHNDKLINPLKTNADDLQKLIDKVLEIYNNKEFIYYKDYIEGTYSPTPSIVEAAITLFQKHNVESIMRTDASAKNLKATSNYISETIAYAKTNQKKILCLLTGGPGAGKTLVGLKIATEYLDKSNNSHAVFLSGNKPLVDILQEALARDKVKQEKQKGHKITKTQAVQQVKAFIQMIHHYRDEYVRDKKAPIDHVVIYDEAQRAWTKEQTVKFMQQKKGVANFEYSEPEFLISCLDRHEDWAIMICLIGGGQEINTGEAGILEWINAVKNKFLHWETRISPHLIDKEYNVQADINVLKEKSKVVFNQNLHLSVSMRSFRAEYLSQLVKEILDIDKNAKNTLLALNAKYPIILTRHLDKAKIWLKEQARGTERYGIVASSQAYRLKPLAIDVKSPINHINWFLDNKDDVRSSYFLEDVATEFQVQGLELDWVCLVWDADLRFTVDAWNYFSFVGSKWQNINSKERQKYLINAYRVLLTRARQGMIIVVPEGNIEDKTRNPEFYNRTFDYLKQIGFKLL